MAIHGCTLEWLIMQKAWIHIVIAFLLHSDTRAQMGPLPAITLYKLFSCESVVPFFVFGW